MYGLRMLSIALVMATVVPLAGATPGENLVPAHLTEGGAPIPVGSDTYYVYSAGSTLEIWKETNACAGLQRDGRFIGAVYCIADTRVLPPP